MAEIPESMRAQLNAWNNGAGVDLESWVGCTGTFALAVGYTTVFCPEFVEFEDYILRGEVITEEEIKNIRQWESGPEATPGSIERVLNHLHILDIQYRFCPDASPDKLIHLGESLKKIYEARLHYLFPAKPCVVKFYRPDNRNELDAYELTFWQRRHDPDGA